MQKIKNVSRRTLGAVLVAGLICLTQLSCGSSVASTAKTIPSAAVTASVECVKQDQAKLKALALDFLSEAASWLVLGMTINFDSLEAQAEAEGTALGQCAFVETIAILRAPKISPAPSPTPESPGSSVASRVVERDPAFVALEHLRSHAGGVTWTTTSGRVF